MRFLWGGLIYLIAWSVAEPTHLPHQSYSADSSELCVDPGSVSMIFFDIQGRTAKELERSLIANGPRDLFGKSRYSLFQAKLAWIESDSCGTLVSESRITLPRWKAKPGSADDLSKRWNNFQCRMLKHELHHYALEQELVAALQGQLIGLKEDCDQEGIQRLVTETRRKIYRAQRNYDTRTRHGQTEGIGLDLL